MVMSLMPKFLIRQSYFRLVASLSGVFLVFQGLVWVLVSSIIEETLWEANIAELYSLTLELERGHLHDHGGDVLWGVGDNIDPSIRRAFMDGNAKAPFCRGSFTFLSSTRLFFTWKTKIFNLRTVMKRKAV